MKRGSASWYFLSDPLALIALVVLLLILILAVFAPSITPYADQGLGATNIMDKLLPPSAEHPFGTDELGRDILARVLFGARTALIAGVSIVFVGVLVGTTLGATAGYIGGWVDELIMRITDVFLAFPPLLLAMTVAVVLHPSLENSILAISITWWPWYARLARGQAVSVRERAYVKAARAITIHQMVCRATSRL